MVGRGTWRPCWLAGRSRRADDDRDRCDRADHGQHVRDGVARLAGCQPVGGSGSVVRIGRGACRACRVGGVGECRRAASEGGGGTGVARGANREGTGRLSLCCCPGRHRSTPSCARVRCARRRRVGDVASSNLETRAYAGPPRWCGPDGSRGRTAAGPGRIDRDARRGARRCAPRARWSARSCSSTRGRCHQHAGGARPVRAYGALTLS